MTLDRRKVAFPFVGGMNGADNPALVQPGELIQLKNGFFYRNGEVRKRRGRNVIIDPIAKAATRVAAGSTSYVADNQAWLAANERHLLMLLSKGRALARTSSYSDGGAVDVFDVGPWHGVEIEKKRVATDVVWGLDMAETTDGYSCVAYGSSRSATTDSIQGRAPAAGKTGILFLDVFKDDVTLERFEIASGLADEEIMQVQCVALNYTTNKKLAVVYPDQTDIKVCMFDTVLRTVTTHTPVATYSGCATTAAGSTFCAEASGINGGTSLGICFINNARSVYVCDVNGDTGAATRTTLLNGAPAFAGEAVIGAGSYSGYDGYMFAVVGVNGANGKLRVYKYSAATGAFSSLDIETAAFASFECVGGACMGQSYASPGEVVLFYNCVPGGSLGAIYGAFPLYYVKKAVVNFSAWTLTTAAYTFKGNCLLLSSNTFPISQSAGTYGVPVTSSAGIVIQSVSEIGVREDEDYLSVLGDNMLGSLGVLNENGDLVGRALVDSLYHLNAPYVLGLSPLSPAVYGANVTATRNLRRTNSWGNTVVPYYDFMVRLVVPEVTNFSINVGREGKGTSPFSVAAAVIGINTNPGPPSYFSRDGLLHVAGGILKVFDGNVLCPIGFFVRPTRTYVEARNLGWGPASSLDEGRYGLSLLYYHKDAAGYEHYSAPSSPFLVDLAAASGLDTFDPYIVASTTAVGPNNLFDWSLRSGSGALYPQDKGPLQALLFQTKADGTVFHLIQTVNLGDPNLTASKTLYSNDNFAWASILGDEIQDNLPLYTTGGVLENVMPPTPHFVASDGQAAYLIPGDDREALWVSKPFVKNVAVEFSQAGGVYRLQDGGPNEAVAFMDGRVFVFKKDQIRVLSGKPQDALGNNGFYDSDVVSPSIGCVSWRSIVNTPRGIFFLSRRGFQLLDRSLNVVDIGDAVRMQYAEDGLDIARHPYDREANPGGTYVIRTIVDHADTSVRCLARVRGAPSGTDEVFALRSYIWNYGINAWSYIEHAAGVSEELVAHIDMAVQDGIVHYAIQSANEVYVYAETDTIGTVTSGKPPLVVTSVTGNVSTDPMVVTTPWLKFDSIQGFGRLWTAVLHGKLAAPNTSNIGEKVKIEHAVDYLETWTTIVNDIEIATLGVTATNPVLEVRMRVPSQLAQAHRFRITVTRNLTGSDDASEGLRLTGMSFDVGVHEGVARLGEGKTY